MSPTERVQRFRSRAGDRRLDVRVDITTFDQVAQLAKRWNCSRQEVLRVALQACLPAMREASSAQDVVDRVRDGLDALGMK